MHEKLCENAPGEVSDDLTVCERAVDGTSHGAEITPAQIGFYRRIGEFPIREGPASGFRRDRHLAHELGADLMAKSARSTVDGQDAFALLQPECAGRRMIENLRDLLHFQIVIARAECAHLAALAFACL